ncbi:MAG: hypothetical protein JJ866_20240 [Roseibium sp.]|uniref:hypothetical protein n=1 Tax=Roseibium sp. TaxID=1936156 RepID=UPI001B16D21B|nr:hypothetical protein [Roseibium sp.]MBO6894284.1 hypothetical protein [Roseibium sp.]MBO6929521.1 hypothetical protein [Roseibium sp.]
MKTSQSVLTQQMIEAYCDKRLAKSFSEDELVVIRGHLIGLLERSEYPIYRGSRLDVRALADTLCLDSHRLKAERSNIQPIFDAVSRSITEFALRPEAGQRNSRHEGCDHQIKSLHHKDGRRRRGKPPPPIVEFPEPLETTWVEPSNFGAALRAHSKRHGESIYHLFNAVVRTDDGIKRSTFVGWGRRNSAPTSATSQDILRRIERRYRLPNGYFSSVDRAAADTTTHCELDDLTPAERRRLVWHLPDDFRRRPRAEQDEILAWVREVIISGSTEYRRYQAAAIRQRYAVRFKCGPGSQRKVSGSRSSDTSYVVDAPKHLNDEMLELLRFKTSTFATFGQQRNGVWGAETASQKVEHFGLFFGAFAAPVSSDVQGFGVDPNVLTFAMMVFPKVWDWYLQWRERRRGFFTAWEIDMLTLASALCREETGWLRQCAHLSNSLREIDGLITKTEIVDAQADWSAACDRLVKHARTRKKEVERVVKIHRDPFEPIMTVLEAPSPVGEYRKITEEILHRMPDEKRHPRAAAEAVRAFLLLRIGLHTGLRQKNLRELLLCKPGDQPTSERKLENAKRGELRWSTREGGCEIFIPSVAFKNAHSSFFGSKPFRLILPDLGQLYDFIDAWNDRHRSRLLGPASDPGTFFVKTAKITSANAEYSQNTFFEAWRTAIQRYGIFNPWTGRGAIKGLLPHGPHNVRDVLATHILKQTGSYEQASYAIQDTPEVVAKHYGRFLPQDKAEIAARILNQVWDAA